MSITLGLQKIFFNYFELDKVLLIDFWIKAMLHLGFRSNRDLMR